MGGAINAMPKIQQQNGSRHALARAHERRRPVERAVSRTYGPPHGGEFHQSKHSLEGSAEGRPSIQTTVVALRLTHFINEARSSRKKILGAEAANPSTTLHLG